MNPLLLYIIGAQKSGTTWLAVQLNRHPEIHRGVAKEMHYWDVVRPPHSKEAVSNIASQIEEASDRDARRFRRHLALLSGGGQDHQRYIDNLFYRADDETKAVFDCTPAYALLDKATFREMAQLVRETRFLYVMRDPVQRLISEARSRPVEGADSSEQVHDELSRRFRARIAAIRDHREEDGAHRRLRADYHKTIHALEDAVDRDRILYAFTEDLFGSTRFEALEEFLGLSEPLSLEPDQVRNPATYGGWRPADEDIALALEALAPVYTLMNARFGDRLPRKWRTLPADAMTENDHAG